MNEGTRNEILRLGAFVCAFALLAPFVVFTVPQVVGAEESYVVVSGSMEPAISPNDAVIVEGVSPTSVESGDVIVFSERGASDDDGLDVTSHRVVGVTDGENGPAFETKGDANEEPDRGLVPASALVGRVAFTIPLIGHVITFASTRFGFFALVGIPLGLLVLGELYDLALAAQNSYEARGAAAGPNDGTDPDGWTSEDGWIPANELTNGTGPGEE